MQLELFISLRYLMSKRRQAFVSVITIISILGVALGVAALIVVLAVMRGFEQDLRDKIVGMRSHVIVRNLLDSRIKRPAEVCNLAKTEPGVVASAPYFQSEAVIRRTGGKKRRDVHGVIFWGIDPLRSKAVIDLEKVMLAGDLGSLRSEVREEGGAADGESYPGILLGNELADSRLRGVEVGDIVEVFIPVLKFTPAGYLPKVMKFRVSGIFKTGMYEFDTSFVYCDLGLAQELFELGEDIGGVAIRVKELNDAPEIAAKLRRRLNDELPGTYSVTDWRRMNANLYRALNIEQKVMFIIVSLVVLVAASNIITSLVMTVMEKERDVGILRSIGMTRKAVMRVFVYQGLIIGTIGTGIGLFLATAICLFLKVYQIQMPGEGIYYIDYIPVSLSLFWDFFVIPVSAMILCFLSALYPAWKAGGMDPVEAMRYE